MYQVQRRIAGKLPIFYGWVVLGCACCAGFARQGPAVATLTIFIVPMTTQFGWSVTEISGAVSVGGILAALTSPLLGPLVDRHGARAMLCAAVLFTGISLLLLAITPSLLIFYLLFCTARMNFAGPFDLGIYGAVNNWFVRRRPLANSIIVGALMTGLTAMPLIAHFAIMSGGFGFGGSGAGDSGAGDWRAGWIAVGTTVLLIGFLPCFFLLARRPEDFGLRPDGDPAPPTTENGEAPSPEPAFTRKEAMRTRAFWMLLAFTFFGYPVQAGVSLHQAPHLIERGLDPTVAAFAVSLFSISTGLFGILFGMMVRRLGVRLTLSLNGVFLAIGCLAIGSVESAAGAYVSAILFGVGIGGLLTVPPIAWADLYGRRSFGAIRGVALTVQVSAQAAGPLLSSILRDWSGDYSLSLQIFTAVSLCAALVILFARPPVAPPTRSRH